MPITKTDCFTVPPSIVHLSNQLPQVLCYLFLNGCICCIQLAGLLNGPNRLSSNTRLDAFFLFFPNIYPNANILNGVINPKPILPIVLSYVMSKKKRKKKPYS